MFNNYDLTDTDIMEIVKKYSKLINKYSEINGEINDDLKQTIIKDIYIKLTKNREK